MSALGNLVVSLIAETAQFRSAMEKAAYAAQKNFASIKRNAGVLAGALAGYFSASMFVSWVKGSIDAADAMYDLSERTGIATDKLSKLQYAAKLSDVSTEEFSANLIKFNRSIAEAARGTGEAQKAFDAMGLSVKDSSGKIKATEVILGEVADKFAQYTDGANKTALATAIFGRSGASMITFLNNGREGLAVMGKELERLGGVIMPDAAKRANEFNDNLERIRVSSSKTGLEIGNILLPYLTDLSDQFLIARKNGLGFWDMFQLGLITPFGNIQEEIAKLDHVYKKFQESGQTDIWFAESINRQRAYLREQAQMDALAIANGDLGDQISRRMASESRALMREKKEAPALAEDKKPVQNEEVIRLLDRQALAVQKLTLSEEELAVAEIFLAGANIQQLESAQRLADVLTKQRTEQEKYKAQIEEALDLYREYKALYDETATPVQKLADEEARLLNLRERLISAGYEVAAVENMIAEARMNAADRIFPPKTADQMAQLKDLAQQFSAAIGTAFEDAIIGGENLRNVLKSLEQDIVRIITRQLVTKPLEKSISGIIDSALTPSGSAGAGGGGVIEGVISSIFGAREQGGPVLSGKTYIVGEKGPEIFVPTSLGNSVAAGSRAAAKESLVVGAKGPELFAAPQGGGTIIPNTQLSSFHRVVHQFARSADRSYRERRDSVPAIAGKRERGGPVLPNKTYLVGEKGPELFVAPKTGGTIIPNHDLASFQKSVSIAAESAQKQTIESMPQQLIAGARANGGLVSPGATYLVGERGPEMFVSETAPSTPASEAAMQAIDRSVTHININVAGVQNSADLRRSAAQVASAAALAVQRGRRNL